MRYLSTTELSDLLDLDRATVRRRCHGLDRHKGPRGATLYASTEALPRIIGAGDERPSTERDRQQARLNQHRADLAQMQADERRGELIPLQDFERVLGGLIGIVRARLMALPVRLSGELPVKLAIRKKCETALRDEVYTLLHEMADQTQGALPALIADMPLDSAPPGNKDTS